MRVLSDDHAAEIQLAWLYRQETELVRRHTHALLMAGPGAKALASEYLAELSRRELQPERKVA
jgi:hypothetical protein